MRHGHRRHQHPRHDHPHCHGGEWGHWRHHHHGRGSRLFRRIFAFGALLLLFEALTVGWVSNLSGMNTAWRELPERVARYLSEHIALEGGSNEAISAEVERVRRTLGIELTVYSPAGALIASSASPPYPPLDAEGQARLSTGAFRTWGRHSAVVAPISRDGAVIAYAIGNLPHTANPSRAAAIGLAVLAVIVLVSVPLAKSISRPIERLTRVVRRFGEGDLEARANFHRRDEVGELAAAFDEMAASLQAHLRNEKELLANVSHELRTPIARIRIALELAAEGDVERARKYLGEISTDLGELEKLVEDVLATARLDLGSDGNPTAHLAPVELPELFAKVADRFALDHPERTLELDLDPGLPRVQADAQLLRRVLDNLVDNARKYSDTGPIRATVRAEASAIRVAVSDEGIGIDPADQAQLFRPFFRSDRSRTRGTGGVGLGLALAKRVVELHGGAIGVQSAPGEGTTVWFTLPRP